MLYGWTGGIMLYGYTLARIKDQKIEIFNFYISRETNIIRTAFYSYVITQDINCFSDLSENWYHNILRLKIPPYNLFKNYNIFKLKKFKNSKELYKRKNQLEHKVMDEFKDIESKINQYYIYNTPPKVDLTGKLINATFDNEHTHIQ